MNIWSRRVDMKAVLHETNQIGMCPICRNRACITTISGIILGACHQGFPLQHKSNSNSLSVLSINTIPMLKWERLWQHIVARAILLFLSHFSKFKRHSTGGGQDQLPPLLRAGPTQSSRLVCRIGSRTYADCSANLWQIRRNSSKAEKQQPRRSAPR